MPADRIHRLTCAFLAAVLVWLPIPAHAAVLDADRIDGAEIGLPTTQAAVRAAAPDVGMAAGVLVTGDGRTLWARFPDDERAMASTTKIMTAIVVLENAGLDDQVAVSAAAGRVGEAAAGIVAGRRYTVRKLVEAMLVKSGNDAAVALAEHVGGTVPGFVVMMNSKARELDLRHTAFTNPHGLDEAGHHTSAADLGTMARYAMALPEFRRAAGLPKTTIAGRGGSIVTLENSNLLIGTYPGAGGVKTGWTNDAGYCVVGAAEREGTELFAVVLGAQSETTRFSYARRLLDWGFEHYTMHEVVVAGDPLGEVPVLDYLDVTVGAVASSTATVPVFDLAGTVTVRVEVLPGVEAPVSRGQRLGTLTAMQGERLLAQVPVTAGEDVAAPSLWQRIGIGATRLWRRVFGGPMVASPVPAQ